MNAFENLNELRIIATLPAVVCLGEHFGKVRLRREFGTLESIGLAGLCRRARADGRVFQQTGGEDAVDSDAGGGAVGRESAEDCAGEVAGAIEQGADRR